jgi:hypothetical protein
MTNGPIPGSFFTNTMTTPLVPGVRNLVMAGKGRVEFLPTKRIMNSLGSNNNLRNFMMLQAFLNNMKAKVNTFSPSRIGG